MSQQTAVANPSHLGLCFYCGSRTSRRFRYEPPVLGLDFPLHFCGFAHAGAYRKAQKLGKRKAIPVRR